MPVLPSSRPIRRTSRTHASLAHGSTGGKPPALYCRPMTPNHVKQRLSAGKACFGSLLNFGDPLVAELMASVGFDWLLVDTAHGPIGLATLATMFATITRYPCAPFVRVHALSEENVKRVLDAGAWGVLAPNVRTREEALRLVGACKYPPQGVRSLGAGRFALSFKTDAPTYFERANDEILVIAQIEHVDAVRNIDAILSVPGIDACYVGPNDWCAWVGETSGYDAVTLMTLIALSTERLQVGSAVVPVQTRTPVVLGLTAASLNHCSNDRVLLGLGLSSRIIVGDWHGLPFSNSLQQIREAVEIVRRVASGERVTFEGAFYRVKNFRMTAPTPARPVRVVLAALG